MPTVRPDPVKGGTAGTHSNLHHRPGWSGRAGI